MKKVLSIFSGIGRAVGFVIKFMFFGFTLWLTTFAGLILWHALPEILILRIIIEMAVAGTFFICWSGGISGKKTNKEENE